ncbi:MAG: hypothetical protein QME79_01015 [Bacillota bacterium]|nr:hypothetical protein [Bacillota bacterium]
MYFTTHLLAGTALGEAAAAAGAPPWTAFLAGLASHAALDMVPHHDYHKARHALLDIAIGLALAALFFRGPFAAERFWGGLGGSLPDLEVAIGHLILSSGRPWRDFFPSHTGALPHPHWPLLQGLLTQLVPAVLAVCLLAS